VLAALCRREGNSRALQNLRSMRTLAHAVAAVTGAGSGLGRETARSLAAAGCALALCDVDAAGLAETVASIDGVRVTSRIVDVSNLAAMTAYRDEVERDFGRVSILVNNAGVALYGRIEDVSIDDLAWIVGINFWGAVYGTKLFLPLLRREPEANIVTVSSVFGLIAPQLQGGYAASKFAIRGFSEVLRHELATSNVRVTVVHPGGIKTKIAANARIGESANAGRFASDTRAFERALRLSPERAAALIVGAIRTNKPRLLIGNDAFLLDAIQRFFPARYAKVLAPLLNPKRAG
jgi:NAD(P)-dependent dehydrogenase (short-subunit alcohol dehydrogenase family)